MHIFMKSNLKSLKSMFGLLFTSSLLTAMPAPQMPKNIKVVLEEIDNRTTDDLVLYEPYGIEWHKDLSEVAQIPAETRVKIDKEAALERVPSIVEKVIFSKGLQLRKKGLSFGAVPVQFSLCFDPQTEELSANIGNLRYHSINLSQYLINNRTRFGVNMCVSDAGIFTFSIKG